MKEHKKYRLKPKARRVLISSILVLIAGLLSIVLFNNGTNILNSIKNYFAAGDVPAHSKNIKNNEDGTYTLSLSVKGEAEKKPQKANVIVVFDTSSSMNTNTGNAEVTYTPVNDNGYERYGKDGEDYFRIYRQSGNFTKYTGTPSTNDTYYGWYNNEFVELTYYGGDWYRPNGYYGYSVYNGDFYTRTNRNTYYYYLEDGTQYTGQRYSRQEDNQSRLEAAQDATNELAAALLSNNGKNGNPVDTIEIALVDFANTAEIAQAPTTDYDTFAAIVNSRDAGNNNRGTNWEAGFRTALNVDFDDDDPTYVIFVSDGNPTYYLEDPQNTTRGGSGQETANNVQTSYNQAVPAAEAIVNKGYNLYTIGIYGNVDRMENITTDAGAPAENYYSASDTAALQAAFGEILSKIEMSGIAEAVIDDGTTEQVKISSSDEHGLLKVVDNSYKYTIAFPIKEGKVQLNGKEATVSGNKITWGDGKELVGQVDESGKNFIYTWTEANDLYNFAPTATNTNGTVEWDLSDCEVLINDATYTVYFDVYPSQETYDMIAKIKNGKTVDERKELYGALNKEVQKYLEPSNEEYTDFSLRTNTTATLSYDDTRTSESEEPVEYTNPDPVATTAQKMQIVKTWENDYDTKAETATVNVRQDGKEYISNITLTNEKEGETNVEEFFIATGLMKVNKATGELTILDSGYDYTFSESGADDYNWELVSETVRPMIINGKLTKLIKLDENVLNTYTEDGTPRYTKPSMSSDYLNDNTNEYYKINGEIYVADKTEGTATLNAINYRRSNLDISKTVDGVGAPETDKFTYTLTIKDKAATDDLYFSILNADGTYDTTQNIEGARVSGDNYIIPKADFIKGVTFTFTLNNGDNVRFFNLTTKATYTVEETGMPGTYKFDKVTAQRKYGKEEPVEDTSATINGKIVNGSIGLTNSEYKVNFVNQYQKTRVIVTKKWTGDNNDEQGLRTPVEVELLANGQVVEGKTATLKADDWTYTWTDLNRYSNGQEIVYTVREKTNLSPHYKSSEPTGSLENGYVIENIRNEDDITVTIPVKKIWEDNNDQDGLRKFVTFELYGTNEDEPVNSYTFQANDCVDNTCTYTFTKDKNDKDLPKYSGGKEINYTIKETGTPGGYQSVNSKENNGTLVITNTHEPSTTKVTATKIWADANNQDNKRPTSITFTLVKNGTPVTDKTCTATEANKWTCSIDGLPEFENGGQPISYSIAELETISGYTTGEAVATVGLVNTFTITNTLTNPEKTEVKVTKNWDDNKNSESTRPGSITVNLYGTDKDKPVKTETLNEDNNWSTTFTDLDKNYQGSPINYTVTEDTVENYTQTNKDKECTKNENTGKFECTLENRVDDMPIPISVTKSWDDNSNQDGKRPKTLAVTITGTVNGNPVDGLSKTITLSGNGDEWTGTFENMPRFHEGKLVTYTISEETLPEGYSLDKENSNLTDRTKFKLVNTREIEKTEVKVTKNWDDNKNSESTRPGSITVNLYGTDKDEPLKTETLNEDNNWSTTFTDLDKNYQGSPINYTVTEDTVENYTQTNKDKECTKNENTGKFECTLENRVDDMPIPISVTKSWDDNSNQDGKRPKTLAVTITGTVNGNPVDGLSKTITLSGNGDEWTGTFENMPRFHEGKLVTYTISEETLPEGYSLDKENSNLTDRTKFKLVNVHEPSKTEVNAHKNWDDNNNQDGIRSKSITFTLVKNGTTVSDKTCTATAETDWSCSIDGLDEYEGGQPISYSIDEIDGIEGYTSQKPKYVGETWTVTNTLTDPEKTQVQVTKDWIDDNNSQGTRKPVTIKLLKNGESTNKSIVLDGTADENGETASWVATFENLDKNEAGSEINYTVEEEGPENYTQVGEPQCESTNIGKECTITNKVNDLTRTYQVKKSWDDENNRDGMQTEVAVTLTGTAKDYSKAEDPIQLNAGNKWTYTFENLPVFNNGNLITYSVEENEIEYNKEAHDTGYTPSYETYEENGVQGTKITNKHIPDRLDISGTKTWKDNKNQYSTRPESITINLIKNGNKETSTTVTPDESGNWSYSFDNLYRYEDGKLITYSLTEEPVEGYKTTQDGNNFINTLRNVISITGQKSWNDSDITDYRPGELTLVLYRNGEKFADVTVNSNSDWKAIWGNLEEYDEDGVKYEYTVDEEGSLEYYTKESKGDKDNNYTVTNTMDTTKVKVTKEWIDDEVTDYRPTEIIVYLYKNGDTSTPFKTATLKAEDDWTYTFENLPKQSNGKDITYSVDELVPENYAKVSSECAKNGDKFECTIENKALDSIVKTYPIKKSWLLDEDDRDGLRAPITVTLTGTVTGTEYKYTDSVVLSGNKWDHIFTNVPVFNDGKLISYQVEESEIKVEDPHTYGYDTNYNYNYSVDGVSGCEIQNSHVPEKIKISGTKTWEDFDNEDGIRPNSITINLIKNGNEENPFDTREVTVAEDGTASFEFTDLYKFEEGQLINYTIKEVLPEGYTNNTPETNQNPTNFEVINYHMPKVTFNVHKDWNDLEDNDGKRPESITVKLLQNGSVVDRITITGPEWNGVFAGWDKYDSNKQPYKYTLEEDPVEYYAENPEIVIDSDNNVNITNTHELEKVQDIVVRKIWNDNNNKNKNRPGSIHINLLADGEKVDEATLSESNGWTYTFTGKLKYKAGKEIVYTVTEDAVKHYDASINGYEITNTYNGPVIEITPPNTGISIDTTSDDSNMSLLLVFMMIIAGFLLRKKYN